MAEAAHHSHTPHYYTTQHAWQIHWWCIWRTDTDQLTTSRTLIPFGKKTRDLHSVVHVANFLREMSIWTECYKATESHVTWRQHTYSSPTRTSNICYDNVSKSHKHRRTSNWQGSAINTLISIKYHFLQINDTDGKLWPTRKFTIKEHLNNWASTVSDWHKWLLLCYTWSWMTLIARYSHISKHTRIHTHQTSV